MKRISIVAAIVCLSALAYARDHAARTTLEGSHTIPSSWELASQKPHAAALHTLSFAVAASEEGRRALDDKFWAVSDPSSAHYGDFFSLAELGAFVGKESSRNFDAVQHWLASEGVAGCESTQAHDWLVCTAPLPTWERLLAVTFGLWENAQFPAEQVLRMVGGSYTVPSSIAAALDFVGGVYRLPDPKHLASKTVSDPVQSSIIGADPHSLRSRYNLTKEAYGKNAKNSQAVAQFLHQYFLATDLEEFFLFFDDLGGVPHAKKVQKVVGPNHIPAGVEASLDIEYIMSLGANVNTQFWSTGGLTKGQEPFLQWITTLLNASDAPLVNSVSYGDDEDGLSAEYMNRVNDEFKKAGTRGISIMFASGDSGAGCNEAGTKFVPSFPSSSPYVTAVGGTISMVGPETTNSLSGGGFSNVFPRPSYQDAAVAGYLASAPHLPSGSFYNKTGRGYPDVAAYSSGFTVVVDFIPMPGVAGTSCASPTFSGIVALINDARLSAGKAPLGFLNPLLYANPAGLDDITQDCSMGCGGFVAPASDVPSSPATDDNGPSGEENFCAAKGWDACTGFGVPNYGLMIEQYA